MPLWRHFNCSISFHCIAASALSPQLFVHSYSFFDVAFPEAAEQLGRLIVVTKNGFYLSRELARSFRKLGDYLAWSCMSHWCLMDETNNEHCR